jgi:hypothetical protein
MAVYEAGTGLSFQLEMFSQRFRLLRAWMTGQLDNEKFEAELRCLNHFSKGDRDARK